MQVSGSIFAVKDNYFEYAKNLKYSNVNYLHIDLFANSNDFILKDILKFNDDYLPLDVHLIYEKIAEEDIAILNKSNAKYLNIQYENLIQKSDIITIGKKFKGNFGISITEKTKIEVLEQYVNDISQVLIMCSEPGVSGAKFSECNYERIRKIKERYPNLKIFADGGIDSSVAEKMNKLGVSHIVIGSYLAKNIIDLQENVYRLRFSNEKNINVTRNMIKFYQLPRIGEVDSFIDIVNEMCKFRLGMVFVTEGERLAGVISDGDIRRGYQKYGEQIFKKVAKDLMNESPYCINCKYTLEQLFQELSKLHKGINVIPVLENDNLIGAIDLSIGL